MKSTVFAFAASLSVLAPGAAIVAASAATRGHAETLTHNYKTYCQYQLNLKRISYCTDLEVPTAKAKCEEKASKDAGEPIVCFCTDDPSYIESRCTEK